MLRSVISAVAGGAGRPGGTAGRTALQRSLRIGGVAIVTVGACALLPGLSIASEANEKEPQNAGSGDARLDAARKRLLATPPPTAAAREQQWQKAVQKLRETEEMYLEECLRHEKKGDMVKLTKSYNRWRECQDELALLERAPRKWLRHHGQYYTYGLRSHMNLLDHAAFVVESNAAIWPLWAGVAFIVARSVYSFFPRPPRH